MIFIERSLDFPPTSPSHPQAVKNIATTVLNFNNNSQAAITFYPFMNTLLICSWHTTELDTCASFSQGSLPRNVLWLAFCHAEEAHR